MHLFLMLSAFAVACSSAPNAAPGMDQAQHMEAVISAEPPPPAATCAEVLAWWSEEGRALRSVAGSNTRYSLEWLPSVCAVCKDRPTAGLEDPEVRAAIAALSNAQQYIVRSSAPSGQADRTVELAAVEPGDVYQLHGSDTVFAALVHAERLPDHVPYRTAILGFEQALGTGQRVVVLSQPGKEVVRFNIPSAAVSNFLALFRSPSNSAPL